MLIHIDRDSSLPIYLQITKQIREMILDSVLPAGYKLPPERKLAEILEVNRSTVLNAYRELKADGFIGARIGQGTVVLPVSRDREKTAPEAGEPLSWRQLFGEGSLRYHDPITRDLMELTSRRDVISFAAGMAAPEFYPLKDFKEIQEAIEGEHASNALSYGPTEGYYSLRESISQLMKSRGVFASPDQVLILSGSQQGLDLIARSFIDPGDVVMVEEPTFYCALQIFKGAGARVLGIPVDDRGIRTDILESLLMRYRPKFIYTLPTFQNPSGLVMDMERRRKLLDLAYKFQVPVVEDDPYGELRYEGKSLPTLKALDDREHVIYLSTFSKVLFPGLRVGWALAPKAVVYQMALVKQMTDIHTGSLSQCIIHSYLKKDLLGKHIKKVAGEYLARRDAMLQALARYAPPEMKWNTPEGGFFIWCRLPEGMSLSRLMTRAFEKKVAFITGTPFFWDEQADKYIRLNFTYHGPDIIKEGVKRIMEAVEETLAETKKLKTETNIEMRPIM